MSHLVKVDQDFEERMGAGRGTPPLGRGCSDGPFSELSAPILKSLGILERGDIEFLCGIFFLGIGSGPSEIEPQSRGGIDVLGSVGFSTV